MLRACEVFKEKDSPWEIELRSNFTMFWSETMQIIKPKAIFIMKHEVGGASYSKDIPLCPKM